MARAGVFDLTAFRVTAFDLSDANDAVRHAAAARAPFALTVHSLRPRTAAA